MAMSTYVPRVSLYRKNAAMIGSVSIADALTHIDTKPGDVTLILGAMRPGYLGREIVTEEDLRRWDAEDESAAAWAAIEDGERAMAEMGLLR